MSKDVVEKLFKELDQMIRQGQLDKARERLIKMRRKKIPRGIIVEFGHLARRTNLPMVGLCWLNPIVRQEIPDQPEATPSEQIAYASNLVRVGATSEAQELLKKLTAMDHSEAWLYRGFAFMAEWNYKSSISCLKKFLKAEGEDTYQRLLCQVNLAAAHVALNDQHHADELISELLKSTQSFQLLFANSLELAAQLAFLRRQFDRMTDFLNQSAQLLKSAQGPSQLFVRKWKAIHDFYKFNQVEALLNVRSIAEQWGHFETVRDCDYHLAVQGKDVDRFLKLYFGTPYKSFQKRLRQSELGHTMLPYSYLWRLPLVTHNHSSSIGVFNLMEGLDEARVGSHLNSKEIIWRFIEALTADFYKPIHLGRLFSELYPGEYFNPWSSPARIKRVISRFRHWARAHELPFLVKVRGLEFSLASSRPYCVRLGQRKRSPENRWSRPSEKIIHIFKDRSFTTQQAAKKLNKSLRSTQRILNFAVHHALIEKCGSGPATRYRLRGA